MMGCVNANWMVVLKIQLNASTQYKYGIEADDTKSKLYKSLCNVTNADWLEMKDPSNIVVVR